MENKEKKKEQLRGDKFRKSRHLVRRPTPNWNLRSSVRRNYLHCSLRAGGSKFPKTIGQFVLPTDINGLVIYNQLAFVGDRPVT